MSTITTHRAPPPRQLLPPLEPGDRLTATEFIRRWEAMPHLKHAELINGVVRMAAAIRWDYHSVPHAHLLSWLTDYVKLTPGVETGAPASVRFDEDNVPEPDALLRIPQQFGGQSVLTPKGYLQGAPELVAEIAASTVSFDLHDKLQVYRRHGVREYLVWRVHDEAIDWFVLREGRFDPLPQDIADGFLKSEVYPGLWLDAPALIRGDLQRVAEVVKQGVAATPGHGNFVRRLQQP